VLCGARYCVWRRARGSQTSEQCALHLLTTWIIQQEEEDGPALSFLHPRYAIVVSISPSLQENDLKPELKLSSLLSEQHSPPLQEDDPKIEMNLSSNPSQAIFVNKKHSPPLQQNDLKLKLSSILPEQFL